MRLRKAVITSAAPNQRSLPLQRFVDRDGVEKAALKIIIEEVVSAGVEEIALVICPGDQAVYRTAAEEHAPRLHFVEQVRPRGYGDALYRAAAFVAGDSFVHLVGDHLYLSRTAKRCAQQLVEIAAAEDCSVSAVQPTREAMLPYYGVVAGRRVPQQERLYEIEHVAEKPTPTEAEQKLIVPGLRAGHYLCLFGMHVLSAGVMEVLAQQIAEAAEGQSIQLSAALDQLARRERHVALEVRGDRYNIGVKYGLLNAQFALALSGQDRDEVLSQIVELLATSQRHP